MQASIRCCSPFYFPRITVENTGSVTVQSFYYNIDIRTCDELPEEALYFHAQYRQVRTRAGRPVTIL